MRCISLAATCTKVNKDDGTVIRYAIKAWEIFSGTGRPKLRENWADFAYAQPRKGTSGGLVRPVVYPRPRTETEGECYARTVFENDFPSL